MIEASFPKLLSSDIAYDIALAILAGFDKHYRLFRQTSQAAKKHFENGDWKVAQTAARERIGFYDRRVHECVEILEERYPHGEMSEVIWREVKLHYIGLLTNHKQPELAETFFNSVSCKILHRTYFKNDFIFVRPAVSTEYIETSEPKPTFRVYYPGRDSPGRDSPGRDSPGRDSPGRDSPGREGFHATFKRIVADFQLERPFADLDRDIGYIEERLRALFNPQQLEPDNQIQVLANLFYRNKGAYIVGKAVNGNRDYPFAVPILHDADGLLTLDTILFDPELVALLFSFTRAYFLVDMEVPSAYVQFIRSLLPKKPRSEIYTVLGLQKQGKTLFYRDYLHHLKHSSDQFEIAPGIKGLVMLVFTLPSFPYVFKAIKDHFPPPKDTSRAQIKEKYVLVKNHDRVGRMADTLEYSDVAFPRHRFTDELIAEFRQHAPSMLEEDGDQFIIKHLYIERRMVPLNIWLANAEQRGDLAAMEHGIVEYGNAIKELVAANIFPGDMLFKNFGVTRYGRVVFYDYDEIEYLTDCHFKTIPAARNEEDELSAEPWFPVSRNDIFPQQFGSFLLGNANVKQFFLKHHADLLTVQYWQEHQRRIQDGIVEDVFPYPPKERFCHKYAQRLRKSA